MKRYTPHKLRKTLAEALILSKFDYGNVAYQNVPKFLIKRLQKVQTISAVYVLNLYAKECDVIKLGWLPIIERNEFNTTKLAFKALYCSEWPGYLSNSNKIVCGTASVLFLVYLLCMQYYLTIVLFLIFNEAFNFYLILSNFNKANYTSDSFHFCYIWFALIS